jgi:hypothetical protein
VPIREVVSQISPPIRILLVLAVAVMGVYMLFLRPKPVEVPPATPANTSVSEPGKIRDAAEDAVDAANGQLAQQESVDGVDAGEAAAGTAATKQGGSAKAGASAATPAEDLEGLPKPLRQAIRKDKVLVLLFWNEKSADDRAVKAALSEVDRWDGRVYVKAAPLKQISRYGRIARGVSVEQSPTVVVADRDLRAETLVGYVDSATIDQTVVDALRNTSGMFTSSYLRAVDKVCVSQGSRMHAIPDFYGGGSVRRADRRLSRYHAAFVDFAAKFKAVKAPKRFAAFRSASIADLAAGAAGIATYRDAVSPKTSVPALLAAERRYKAASRPIADRFKRRTDAQGLFRCGSQF